jgi:hypothetical protein
LIYIIDDVNYITTSLKRPIDKSTNQNCTIFSHGHRMQSDQKFSSQYEPGRDDYDGTVFQLNHDDKQWGGQANFLTGSLFPNKNLVWMFDRKISIWEQFHSILTSKDSLLYLFGFGIFFGYIVYRYLYIMKRKRKDLVDIFMESRFKRDF